MSNIEWTTETWNPIVGCSKISAGCQNCYAIKEAHRLAGNPNPKISDVYRGLTERRGDRIEWTGAVKFIPERLAAPLQKRKPTTYFVNSMSDLFHESVTDEQIDQIFSVIARSPQHIYQILTKRPERMLAYMTDRERHGKILLASQDNPNIPGGLYPLAPNYPFSNVWLGVTVENQKAADERIPLLLQTPAKVRFLSCEPLLEEIVIPSAQCERCNSLIFGDPPGCHVCKRGCFGRRLHWVIVGGESGHNARPFNLAWGESLIEQCKAAGIPVFFKQLGTNAVIRWDSGEVAYPTKGKGGDFNALPLLLQVRQFPELPTPLDSRDLREL